MLLISTPTISDTQSQMAGGKKSKSGKGPRGANQTNTEGGTPSFHGRTFVNSNVAPMQQSLSQSSQRIVRCYDRIRQEQETRRAIETPTMTNAPSEVPETVISLINPKTGSPHQPRTQDSTPVSTILSTNSSNKSTPVKETIKQSTTLTPKSISNIETETRSRTPARTIMPTSRDTSVAIETRTEKPSTGEISLPSVSTLQGTPQYTKVLSRTDERRTIAVEFGNTKFNVEVDYSKDPPKATKTSPTMFKRVPPPLKQFNYQPRQLNSSKEL